MLLPSAAILLAEARASAHDYLTASRSEATLRSYRTGWTTFCGWCTARGVASLPAEPETVASFIADLADTAKPATLDVRLSAVSAAHRAAGFESPTRSEVVRLVRRGVRRTKGTDQRRARAITVPELRAIVEVLGDDLGAVRDRAILLLGFAGAFRRSELVGLDVDDLVEGPDGLSVQIRRSKTDQEGSGRTIGIPFGKNEATCPVRAWNAWLWASCITEGPAFRSVSRHDEISALRLTPQAIAHLLKRRAAEVGIDPTKVSGHSLRAGLATAAAEAGVPERIIQATTGHKGTAMLRRYIQEGSLFRENAAAAVGL